MPVDDAAFDFENRLYERLRNEWSKDPTEAFYSTLKVKPLSENARNGIFALGQSLGVQVRFMEVDGQHYVVSLRPRKSPDAPKGEEPPR